MEDYAGPISGLQHGDQTSVIWRFLKIFAQTRLQKNVHLRVACRDINFSFQYIDNEARCERVITWGAAIVHQAS
jgi:hypothetical protein